MKNPLLKAAAALRGWMLPPPAALPHGPLRVLNLTRGAVLAERVDLAATSSQRRQGLLGRAGLDPGQGLWIVPCESVHTFFMRFSIDLVYLDRASRVRKVRPVVGPWRLSACLSAHSILELAPGSIHASGTRPGDQLEFLPAGQTPSQSA